MLMPVPSRTQPTHPGPGSGEGWTVLLPLKGGQRAKSRLGASPELASAIALDTLRATLCCPVVREVRVITSDPALARSCTDLGAYVCPESVRGAGLRPAVRDGIRALVGSRTAGAVVPVAVLLGDLPAMRPQDLRCALDAMAGALTSGAGGTAAMGIVPDLEGTGTVLLAASAPRHLVPAFGPGSAAAHVRAGALRLALDLPRLRLDVDTRADLRRAVGWGVGPLTAERLRIESGTGPSDGACPGS